jgi:hypothetical protein
MERSTRFKLVWATWMTVGGLLVATVVLLTTGSWWWALVALLASGTVLNAIGSSARQPARPVRRSADGSRRQDAS